VSTLAKTFLTPEQYLEIERKAEFRSEYYQGEMFGMAGGSGRHTVISDNLVTQLNNKLRGGPCRPYSQNMRVQISATGLYTYPDVVVACAGKRFLDENEDTLLNPALIIEILSDSTEAYDRGKKFAHYRTLESLQEYVLVSQDRVQVERFRRQPGGEWLLAAVSRLEDTVELDSVGCQIQLADIYQDVNLPTGASAGLNPR
jgi:Uma2 family endonuclease